MGSVDCRKEFCKNICNIWRLTRPEFINTYHNFVAQHTSFCSICFVIALYVSLEILRAIHSIFQCFSSLKLYYSIVVLSVVIPSFVRLVQKFSTFWITVVALEIQMALCVFLFLRLSELQSSNQLTSRQCDSKLLYTAWISNTPHYIQNSNMLVLHQDGVIPMIVFPIIVSTVFRSIIWEIIVSIWSISFIAVLISIWHFKIDCSISIILISFFMTLVIIYEIQRLSVQIFIAKMRITETERNEVLHQAAELRSMIANVAHDLKTPIAGSVSGIDFIDIIVKECISKLHRGSLLKENLIRDDSNGLYSIKYCKSVSEGLSTIQESLQNVKSINSFMLMAINRCIDYTKSSQGILLISRPESFKIAEALEFTLICIRGLQSRVDVTLAKSIPTSICSHIISDKQWLQENILCLLSNAVKYSTKGPVVIDVSLESHSVNSKSNSLPSISVDQKNEVPAGLKFESYSISTFLEDKVEDQLLIPDSNSRTDTIEGGTVPRRSSSKLKFTIESNEITNVEPPPYVGTQVDDANLTAQYSIDRQQYLRIEVKDSGITLPDKDIDSLFTPCKQTQRIAGGTGLGLYSLARRVDALKGYYGVKRRDDGIEGAVFWFAIPYEPDYVASILSQTPPEMHMHEPNTCTDNISYSPSHINVENLSDGNCEVGTNELPIGAKTLTVTKSAKLNMNGAIPQLDLNLVESHDTITSRTGIMPNVSNIPVSVNKGNMDDELFTATDVDFEGIQAGSITRRHTISLPLTMDITHDIHSESSPLMGRDNKPLAILIVDDSMSILKMTSMLLAKKGYIISDAINGAVALEKVTEAIDSFCNSQIYFQPGNSLDSELGANASDVNTLSGTSSKTDLESYSSNYTNSLEESQTSMMCCNSVSPKVSRFESRLGPRRGVPNVKDCPNRFYLYDAIIMDIQMPVMDGLEATRRIRQYEEEKFKLMKYALPRNIIIGCTANSDSRTYQDAVLAGVDGFIEKPLTYTVFESTLRRIMQVRNQ